jgi:hypothetical protein
LEAALGCCQLCFFWDGHVSVPNSRCGSN